VILTLFELTDGDAQFVRKFGRPEAGEPFDHIARR
jgi:hypothetical protein